MMMTTMVGLALVLVAPMVMLGTSALAPVASALAPVSFFSRRAALTTATVAVGVVAPAMALAEDDGGVTTASGLRYYVAKEGRGEGVARGQRVKLDYSLREQHGESPPVYIDGTKQSYPPRPLTCVVGVGAQIVGFDEAVLGMRVGEKRVAVVPPALAYGKAGTLTLGGVVPPDATLIYTLELLAAYPLDITPEQRAWIDENPFPLRGA